MIKKLLSILGILFIILFIAGYFFVAPKIPILSGYVAKNMCSCHFGASRNIENISTYDLNFSPINLASFDVNEKKKEVVASVFGMGKQRAVFKKGLGCQLIIGQDDYHIEYPKTASTEQKGFQFEQNDSIQNTLDQALLNDALTSAFKEEWKTRALLAVHKNQIILEKYGEGVDPNTPQLGWSMTKSIVNALIGILIQQGKLNVHQKRLFEEWKNDERKNIEIHHLLQMNSGLSWEEEYGKVSDITKLLYLEENILSLAINKPLAHDIGTNWYYASGTTNILCGIIKQQFKRQEDYLSFPKSALFDKLGMKSAFIECDESGNFIGSSFGFATARDWARFALLYLNNGAVNGEQLFPEDWVEYSTTPVSEEVENYGAQIWLNYNHHYFKDLPSEMYSFNGFQGQRVAVFPNDDLVIVRLGHSSDFDVNEVYSKILKAVQ